MRSPRSSSQRGFDTPTGPRRGSPAAILVRDRVSQARTRERPDRLRRRHFGPGTVTTRAGRLVPTDDRAGRARRLGGLCSRAWPPRCTSSSSRRPPMRAASPFTSTPGSGARDSTPLRVSPRARVHRRTDKGPLCSAARARECPARGGGPRGRAGAPQNLSPSLRAPQWRHAVSFFCREFRLSRPRPPRRAPPFQGGARSDPIRGRFAGTSNARPTLPWASPP
jgi:hypothetical protein